VGSPLESRYRAASGGSARLAAAQADAPANSAPGAACDRIDALRRDGARQRLPPHHGAPAGAQERTLNAESFAIGTRAGAGAIPADFARRTLVWAAHHIPDHDRARPWRAAYRRCYPRPRRTHYMPAAVGLRPPASSRGRRREKAIIRSSGCAISQSASDAQVNDILADPPHKGAPARPDFNRREPIPMLHQRPA
jgi:hypothetical protein